MKGYRWFAADLLNRGWSGTCLRQDRDAPTEREWRRGGRRRRGGTTFLLLILAVPAVAAR